MEPILQTDYIKLLELFILHDQQLPSKFLQPFRHNGYYVATDTTALIMFPIGSIDLPYDEQATPIIKNAIPPDRHEPIIVNIADLEKNILAVTAQIDIMEGPEPVSCSNCEGYGSIAVALDDEIDCPKCNGDGFIDYRKPSGKKQPDPEFKLLLWGIGYRFELLNQLIQAAKILQAETVKVVHLHATRATVIEVADATILLCPCRTDTYPHVNFTQVPNYLAK
jgi:hypothetical protein